MKRQRDDFDLPELRSDLHLIEGPVALDGSPSWLIVDPLRNKYFSIGWSAFQLLSRWTLGTAKKLISAVQSETTLNVGERDVKSLIEFLLTNSLTREPASGTSLDYLEQYEASKSSFLVWLVHHYLFFKIPLVKPTRFLRRTLIYVEPIFSYTTRAFVFTLGLVGLFMVGRQWEEFVSTFLYFFNLQGLLFYFLSLVFIKVLHELAHAYTVIRYGCKVPTMGVAFLVMFPLLYTDTSDTWRIKSATQRVNVGAAGMLMELYIALVATFAWSFFPEGHLKSAAFILATTSWVMSLAINVNPLMRFDGYYILSDLLHVQNLQARSFEIGKWKLTELLFGLKLKPPEALSDAMLYKLTIYAWCVWVYRFFLFIAIALLVYHFFFKLLGIILFVLEIFWFIVLPMVGMLKKWWDLRASIKRSRRTYVTAFITFLLLIAFIVPWKSTVSMPAMMMSGQTFTVFAPGPAQIKVNNMKEGLRVSKGDILIELSAQEIDKDIELTRLRIEQLKLQARRIAASEKELDNVQVIIQQLQESRSRLKSLLDLQEKMLVRSPINGVLQDVTTSLHNGRWIDQSLPLANIVVPKDVVIEGVLGEDQLHLVKLQAPVRFIPDNAQINSIWGIVFDIEEADMKVLDLPALSSVNGGTVPSTQNQDGQLIPNRSIYRLRAMVSEVEQLELEQVLRGVLHVEAEKESFLSRSYKLVMTVLIRESGF